MGVTSSTSQQGLREVEPSWVRTVQMPPECVHDKIGGQSDGMMCTGPNAVLRNRKGHFDSDAARWSRGFTSGKHAFEIVFPRSHRGAEATVGVGTDDTPLYAKGKVPLVGSTRDSWGISLRTRRAFHRNAQVKKYPSTLEELPDRFFLYLDVDGGLLQFGSDCRFYGTALNNIPRDKPLYPMVSSTAHGASISIVYRGRDCGAGPVVQVAQPLHPQQQTVVVAPAYGTTVITTGAVQPPAGGPYPHPQQYPHPDQYPQAPPPVKGVDPQPPPPYTPEEAEPAVEEKK